MSIIYRYIYKKLLTSLFAVTLTITSLIAIFVFVGELDALRKDYQLINSIWYVFISIPSILFEVLPFVCLIAVLLVVGKMVEDNEITVLQISGISTFRLSIKILTLVFFIVCAFLVADNFIFSKLNLYKEDYKNLRKYPHLKEKNVELWLKERDAIILLTSIKPQGKLGTSHIFQFNDNYQLLSIQRSDTGKINDTEISFADVNSTNIIDTSEVQIKKDTKIERNIDFNVKFNKLEKIAPELLSLTNLYQMGSYLMKQRGTSNVYWATLIAKAMLPINIIALAFLSLAFIFGSTRSMTTGSRVFIGIVVGLIFHFINRLAVPIHLVTGIPAIISVLFPGMLALLLGLALPKMSIKAFS